MYLTTLNPDLVLHKITCRSNFWHQLTCILDQITLMLLYPSDQSLLEALS